MKRLLLVLLACSMLLISGVSFGDDSLMVQGDKGEEVVRVQMRLFDLGFYTYKPTGSFQTVTRSAVVAYQVASGLMSDGSIGAETMQSLFSRGAKRVDFHAEVPLTFTAQGAITQRGNAMTWDELKARLTPETVYTVRNAANNGDWTKLAAQNEGNWPLVSSNFQSGNYRQYAVTFVENHDTEYRSSTAQQDPLRKDTLAANAYLLAMPGTPCVFLKHWQAYKQEIANMAAVRKAVGITKERLDELMAEQQDAE